MVSNVRELPPRQRSTRSTNEDRSSTNKKADEHDDIETGNGGGAEEQQSSRPEPVAAPLDISIRTKDEEAEEYPSGSNSLDETEKSISAEVTVIRDINVYAGSTLEEKIEKLIDSHPVVMFNRTWCLFSVDAINFLVMQLNVSVHSLEVDVHPHGKEILNYVMKKTDHNTTPLIFIRGDFLGGFSEVNALYAQGTLQQEYLKGLSQAEQCEMNFRNTNYQTTPYFWFPEKVDAYVVRITGALTCFVSGLAAVLVHFEEFSWVQYVACAIAFDFMLRLLGGARISLIGRIAMFVALPLDPMPRMGKPKQFATVLGLLFSTLGSVAYLVSFPYHTYVGSGFMGGLAIATGMEGFLDFCVGCTIFRIGVNLGIFKGTS